MKRILVGSCLFLSLIADGYAAKGPEIQMIDGKLSIQVEAVTLSRFMHLLDAATGMTSKVSPEFANQKISVRLEGLDLNAAIRKSFQGQPWNYSIIAGKGITIMDRAQAVAAAPGGASSLPIQTSYTNDPRIDVAPSPNATPFPPATPLPAAANGGGPAPGAPANASPAQGGAPAPTPLFQPIGGSLSTPLPSAQPAGR